MGYVDVDELPYYAYRRYPFGARRVPVYNSSFPGHLSGDYTPYYENSIYGGNPAPLYVVEAPFTGDDGLVRKRNLNGLEGEANPSGDRNARNVLGESGSKSGALSSSSKAVRSPAVSSSEGKPATRVPEPHQIHSAELNHSSKSSPEKSSRHSRVISIPVVSTDEGKDSTVVPQEGTRKSRKAISAEGAAVLIQSWFKGFQVRKTAPLTQLRMIAKVKSQCLELEEKASDIDLIKYAGENPAARMRLTESIMRLLLQLDAIQGAIPVVREIRRLATKEVIGLQGRVDALLSSEVRPVELCQLPVQVEKASGDGVDRDIVTATESQGNESIATAIVDAEPDPDQESDEVGAVEDGLNAMKLEVSRADVVETNEANERLSVSMAEPDPDQETGKVGTVQSSLGPIVSEAVDSETTEVNKSTAGEIERFECEGDQPMEAQVHHDFVFENESASNSGHEEGEELARAEATPEAVEVTTVGADTVKMNTNDERAVQSIDVTDVSPQETSQKIEVERGEIDDGMNGNAILTAGDLSEGDDGDLIHPLNAKGSSLPYSPRSPFDCLDFPPSISDCELESELQESPETIQDGPTGNKGGNGALLLKLSEENKALKSLLVDVMKWNQMQATILQEVNHRLERLESRMSPRIDKKKSSSRRIGGKSSRMIF